MLVLGGIGAIVGAIMGGVATTSCNPNTDICIGNPGTWVAIGAIVLGLVGAGIGLVVSLLWLLGRRAARHWSGAAS